MTYRQAKKVTVGEKIILKPNQVLSDGKIITVTAIDERTDPKGKPIIWFQDENGGWHWHKFHKVEV